MSAFLAIYEFIFGKSFLNSPEESFVNHAEVSDFRDLVNPSGDTFGLWDSPDFGRNPRGTRPTLHFGEAPPVGPPCERFSKYDSGCGTRDQGIEGIDGVSNRFPPVVELI